MADVLILGLVGAIIILIVYYLDKQRQSCHSEHCVGCAENKNGCRSYDVETLKKELKAQLHK